MITDKLKRYKSPDTDQILAELIQEGGTTLCYEIHKLIKSIWDKKELSKQWQEYITVPINKKGDETDCSNYRGISLLPTTYKMLSSIILLWSAPLLGIISVDFDVTYQLLIRYSTFITCWKRDGSIMGEYTSYF